MAEPIVINAETREITVPESERSFGVAGEHNVARKHFRINGRIVDGNDLAVGFAWKVCTENSAKQPNEYPIDSIIADSDGIEFDWLVGKGALTYKGSLKFAVCAKQVNGEGKVQHEWHSRIGTGTVYDGIEASAEDIGGFDLRAYIQQTAAEVRQAVQDAAASAKNAETQASDAAAAAKTAGDAATKVIEEGVAEKLTEMQNIQKDVSTKAQTAETAAKNAGTAKTAAQNAQNAAEKSAGNAANSESAAKTSAEQAAAARDTAQELAGRVTVDDTLSDASASPVQNKVIFAALAKKQDVQRVTFVINDTDGGLDAVVAD